MSMFEEWKNKKMWDKTLPYVPVFRLEGTDYVDMSLAALCDKAETLTLDPEVGFKEITMVDIKDLMREDYLFMTEPLEKVDRKPEEFAKLLLEQVKIYLTDLWDSNRMHLIFHSGDMDSRIISWTLKELRDENGKDWLGDIHFRCHEPEGDIFKTVMKKQGWDESQYSVHKEGRVTEPDYYNFGDFDWNNNCWFRPGVNFWDEIIPKGEEKNVTLVSGLFGGENLCYPIWPQRARSNNRFEDLMSNGSGVRPALSRAFNTWGDILLPYLSYEYLKVSFELPNKYLVWVDNQFGQQRDLIRTEMLKVFKDDTILYIGHKYNRKISDERRKYMKERYQGSKFFRDFGHLDFVRNARAWDIYKDENLSMVDLKLYSYATMYEYTNRGGL